MRSLELIYNDTTYGDDDLDLEIDAEGTDGTPIKIDVEVDEQKNNASFDVRSTNGDWFKYRIERYDNYGDGDTMESYVKILLTIPRNISTWTRLGSLSVEHNAAKIVRRIELSQLGVEYPLLSIYEGDETPYKKVYTNNGSTSTPWIFKSVPDELYEERRIELLASNGRGKWYVKEIRQYEVFSDDGFPDSTTKYIDSNFDKETSVYTYYDSENNEHDTYNISQSRVAYDGALTYRIEGNYLVVRSYGQIDMSATHMRYFFVICHSDVGNTNKYPLNNKNIVYEDKKLFIFDGNDIDGYGQNEHLNPSTILVITLTYDDISSDGGTSEPHLTYTLYKYDDDGNYVGTITSGGSVTYTFTPDTSADSNPKLLSSTSGTIEADSTESLSRIPLGEVTVTVTVDGVTRQQSATVYQSSADYIYAFLSISLSYSIIPSNGGTVYPVLEYILGVYRNEISESNLIGTIDSGADKITYSFDKVSNIAELGSNPLLLSSGAVKAGVINSTASNSTEQLGTVTVTVTMNGLTGTAQADILQGTLLVYYEYSDITIWQFEYTLIPAEGGNARPTYVYSQTISGTDGSETTIWAGGTVHFEFVADISATTNPTLTSDSTGWVHADETMVTNEALMGIGYMTVEMNGKSVTVSAEVWQEAAVLEYTYSNITVTLSYDDISGLGGSVYPYLSYSVDVYANGQYIETVTSGGDVSYSFAKDSSATSNPVLVSSDTGEIKAGEATETERAYLGEVTVTVAFDGIEGTATAEVYQEAAEDELYMDICFYDRDENVLVIVDKDAWNIEEYPAVRYCPLGIVVIPTSHNVYSNNSCGVVSLLSMSCDSPDAGSNKETGMMWGGYETDIAGLTNYNYVLSNGTPQNPQDTGRSIEDTAYLPSDNFRGGNGVACPNDERSWYYNVSDMSNVYASAPSPYTTDEGRNSLYYSKSSGGNVACSDLDGKTNTSVIIELATAQRNWRTDTTITDSSNEGYYPAACCCWRFYTEGTNQGSWYLPSCGEFGYVMVRLRATNKTIERLISDEAYGSSYGATLDESAFYWTSTEYSDIYARHISTLNGNIDRDNKGDDFYVRAFQQVWRRDNYSSVAVTLSYDPIPAEGGTVSPSLTYSQTFMHSDGTVEKFTSGATVSYSIDKTNSTATSTNTFNSSTGDATASETTSTNDTTIGEVTVTVTLNGKTSTANATIIQLGSDGSTGGDTEIEYTYSELRVTLSYDTISGSGGSVRPNLSYEMDVYGNGNFIETITSGGTASYSFVKDDTAVSNPTMSSTTGIVSAEETTATEKALMGEVTVTVTLNDKTGTATAEVWQAATDSDELDMDVVLHDTDDDSLVIVDKDEWNADDYPPETYDPIGLVVVPADHDAYDDGSCGVMSFNNLTIDSNTYIYWGESESDSILDNYDVVAVTGTARVPGDEKTVTGADNTAFLPSDNFSAIQSQADNNTWFDNITTTEEESLSTSPYLTDGSRNPVYYATQDSSGNTITNALSDFKGTFNSDLLTEWTVSQPDWQSDNVFIINSNNYGYYPAACVCRKYSTGGTSKGDWYLPAMGELGYVAARMKKINDTTKKLAETYGFNYSEIESGATGYWSSTEGGSKEGVYPTTGYAARYLLATNGYVGASYKSFSMYVRPFLRMTENGVVTSGVPTYVKRTADYGDICLYDMILDKYIIVDRTWELRFYPSSRYNPIGIVAIPSSHDVYGTGECAIVSLKYMNYNTPNEGDTTVTPMRWDGNTTAKDLSENNYTAVPITGTIVNPGNGTVTDADYEYEACLPSDNFDGAACPTDPKVYYYPDDDASVCAIPSPYLSDETRNSAYYNNSDSSSPTNVLSDFDGKNNTDIATSSTPDDGWKTEGGIVDNADADYFPAACCCWRYCPTGTEQGEWYLPAMGELGYVIARLKVINESIDKVIVQYGEDSACHFAGDGTYWSSSEYDAETAWYLWAEKGFAWHEEKGENLEVRAFLRIKY